MRSGSAQTADHFVIGDEDRALVELLQCALARLDERPRAADHDERRLGRERIGDGGHHSGDARPRGHHGDAAGAVDPAPGLGGVCGRLLVAHVDHPHPLDPAPLVDGHHVPAAEREDRVDALRRDRLRRQSPALNLFRHPARA